MFAGRSPAESRRLENEHFSGIGALILGRRMADVGIGPWGEEPTFHAPCFVVTHRSAETIARLIAMLRAVARNWGDDRVRTWERSSSKVRSRT
jgi:hypothetical protein